MGDVRGGACVLCVCRVRLPGQGCLLCVTWPGVLSTPCLRGSAGRLQLGRVFCRYFGLLPLFQLFIYRHLFEIISF